MRQALARVLDRTPDVVKLLLMTAITIGVTRLAWWWAAKALPKDAAVVVVMAAFFLSWFSGLGVVIWGSVSDGLSLMLFWLAIMGGLVAFALPIALIPGGGGLSIGVAAAGAWGTWCAKIGWFQD